VPAKMITTTNTIFFHFGTAQESRDDIERMLQLSLIILDQVHGINGQVITNHNTHRSFTLIQGDFLVTNQRAIALGVLTADCLPIILIDKTHNAVGIVHAGWRGSVKNIVNEVVQCMQQQYGTGVTDLSIFFGPCARVCCYKVQKDFLQHLEPFSFGLQTIVQRDDNLFFDVPSFNKYLLLSLGLPQTAFNDQYNYCTICNDEYFSYRRQGDKAGRQVSVVWIK
jgi:YfiH family protein